MTLFHFYHEMNEFGYTVLYCIILREFKCYIENDFVGGGAYFQQASTNLNKQ